MKLQIPLRELTPKPVPPGTYIATIEEVSPPRFMSTDDGSVEILDIRWRITDGDPHEAINRIVRDSIFLTLDGLWKAVLYMTQVLGIPEADLPTLESTEEVVAYLVENLEGTSALITLKVQDKDGRKYNRITQLKGSD